MSHPNPDRKTRLAARRAEERPIDGDPTCQNCGGYLSQHARVRHAGKGKRIVCLFAPTFFEQKRKEGYDDRR